MDPFELFAASDVYKVALLYFSKSRGLAIVGRNTEDDNVEVIRLAGEVDPSTGKFIALEYSISERIRERPVISKEEFEDLVSYIETKIDDQIRMSVVEPDVLRFFPSESDLKEPGGYVH
jgi:hypothetical protein